MSKILLFHLQNSKTIDIHHEPKATLLRRENLLEKCGFKLFIKLVSKLSPQLGGPACDLEVYVKTLKISNGEPVLDFYTMALIVSNKIKLQQDHTGQNNRLIRRFVHLLFHFHPFVE